MRTNDFKVHNASSYYFVSVVLIHESEKEYSNKEGTVKTLLYYCFVIRQSDTVVDIVMGHLKVSNIGKCTFKLK